MKVDFGPAAIVSILSVVLSVLLETLPGAREWWNTFAYKRLTWLVGCFVAPAVWVGMAYAGAPVGIVITGPFIWDGLFLILTTGAMAYAAGQAMFTAQASDLARKRDAMQEVTREGE